MTFKYKKIGLILLLQSLFFVGFTQQISLNGDWTFSLDPLQKGEIFGWHTPWKIKENDSSLLVQGFDKVQVPHTYTLDSRYNLVGKVWYRKAFKLATQNNSQEIRIHFEAIFHKARIFINGNLVSYHEGGYTPFTVSITKYVKPSEVNFISVEVDNSWDEFSLPGARISDNSNAQLFPWYEYGGIIRDVSLLITNKLYISNQKIESIPNLAAGTAKVKVFTWIENKFNDSKTVSIQYDITNRSSGKEVEMQGNKKSILLNGYSKKLVEWECEIKKGDMLLWDCDNPNLYDIQTTLNETGNTVNNYTAYFGIRSFKVQGTQLLLNGNPIRMAGANRPSDHPLYGSSDPDTLAKLDMKMMRNGQMIFSRISHTPMSRHFYKWADENGYLIIAEITNWQLSNVQMTSQRIKDAFQAQMRELVENFWNSPSIVAYSTGNEYPSWTPEGDEWTRYQIEKFRELDTTRLMTFVAIGTAASPTNLKLAHNSFRYCDFLNFNNYSDAAGLNKNIENIHQQFPDKPIFVSEAGVRSDQVKDEQERIKHLDGVISVIKKHPYAIGFAYWTFNDYLSRYTSTNKNGYRPWGIVDANRNPKELYQAFQKKLSPVLVSSSKNSITITGKDDFPSYTIQNHILKVFAGEKQLGIFSLPIISPGQSIEIPVNKMPPSVRIVIENKVGIVIYDSGNK